VGGGHAIVSNAAICIVNTPLQKQKGIIDSVALATKDFVDRGGDANRDWVDRYTKQSKLLIFDWLTKLGVEFYDVGQPPGNSVPRLHFVKGKGWGLIEPILRECLRRSNIHFVWNTKAEHLLFENGSVTGVRASNLRTGFSSDFRASDVIIASGGFGSNLPMIRDNWPSNLSAPERLLAGASHMAQGSGFEMVQAVGGTISHLDHQWNYVLGLPDPTDHTGKRGLAAFDFRSIWVNDQGRRFTPEFGDEKVNLKALLSQPNGDYWSILDSDGRPSFAITLAGWENGKEVDRLVFQTPGVAISASLLRDLSQKIGAPPEALPDTVSRYNRSVEAGVDRDFHAFDHNTKAKPHKIEKPPFYAVRFFPITRKTMGGIDIDTQCRVLDHTGRPIANLYAVGEATGFGKINGRAALEGTFLGPSILMGRIAAQSAVNPSPADLNLRSLPVPESPAAYANEACLGCHDLQRLTKQQRKGYWHFEQSHAKVIDRQYRCASCHQSMFPFEANKHGQDRLALMNACKSCHSAQPRR
jgi:predicted oxidoreductase